MTRVNHKRLESQYSESQGSLETRITKGGLKVTTRQIAKVLASHLPYSEIERSEPKAKFSVECDFQEVARLNIGKAIGLLNESTLDNPVRKVIKASQVKVTIPTSVKVTMLESRPPKHRRPKLSQFRRSVDWLVQEIASLPSEVKTSLACGYIFSSRVPRQDREDTLQEIVTNLLEYTQAKLYTVGLGGDGIVGLASTGYTLDERLAYTKAKYNLRDIWRTSKQYSQNDSLDSISENSPDILDYSQKAFNQAIESMKYNHHTTETLRVEKLLHDTAKTQYTSEASTKAQDKELFNNLRDAVEYETQSIAKLDCKSLIKQLPKSIQHIVKRIDLETGDVKNSHALSTRERKALHDFRHSAKGRKLLESMQS